MKMRKLVSLLAALALIPSLPALVSAKSIYRTETIMEQDLSSYEDGATITAEELAQIGFNITPDGEGSLPEITVVTKEYPWQNNTTRNVKTLCFKMTKNTAFSLSHNIDFAGDDLGNPEKVDVNYFYMVEDDWSGTVTEETPQKRIGFDNFGKLNTADGELIFPSLNVGSIGSGCYMLIKSPKVSNARGNTFVYKNWNKMAYNLDYSASTLTISDTWKSGYIIDNQSAEMTSSALPTSIEWKPSTKGLANIADNSVINLYISDFSVTADYVIPNDTVSSSETTFFDGAGATGSATMPSALKNNVFEVTDIRGITTAKNTTELPATADSLGFQFCGLNVPDGAAKLILARYAITDDNFKKLTDVSVNDVTITDGKAVSDTPLDLTKETADGTLVQAYIWDNLKNITPLSVYGSAEIGTAGEKIYSLSFENEQSLKNSQREDISNVLGTVIPLDNGQNTIDIVSDEPARYGDKSLKTVCLAKSELTGQQNNGFQFRTLQRDGFTKLSEEAANSIGQGNKYRISFYAKSELADATVSAALGTNVTTEALYYWRSYPLFKDVTVKAGDWQYFVIYTDLPDMSQEGFDWSQHVKDYAYDLLKFSISTDTHQAVYFDNILVEKLAAASAAE